MAELPKSWGLTEKVRPDGRVDIIGRDDLGAEYRVRTTTGPGVSESDVAAIADVDRERTTARAYIQKVISEQGRREADRERAFEDDLIEGAGPVVHAGLERRGSTTGYTRQYAAAYDRVFNKGERK